MNPRGLAAATVDLGLHGYTPERKVAFYTLAVERARQVPGVEIAAIGTHVPLARLNRLPMSPVEEARSDDAAASIGVGLVHVSPEYFDVLGVPLLRGRRFTAADDMAADRVGIVNESAARSLAPGIDIIGRRVNMLGRIAFTVVGVVADNFAVRWPFPSGWASASARPRSPAGVSSSSSTA